ncbi:MAG: zinc-dependent peptidase [Myxococcales bacterium]|nr:zinc-dependent peptidase [Myxococcales bacterium]
MTREVLAIVWRAVVALVVAAALVALGVRGGSSGVAVAGPIVAMGVLWFSLRRPLRAWRAARAPLDPEVTTLLERHVRHFAGLSDAQRDAFSRRVARLLATLEFESVDGARDTLELRVMAVAGAALLYVGRDDLQLDETRSVVFYPDAFSEDYDVAHDARIAGMVHRQGPVLFSERALRDGWDRSSDGYNVSVHEWAHVLDLEDGFADGIPGLAAGSQAEEQALLTHELARARGGRSVLRDYAGTNRAELFAVATEVFFERPALMRKSHSQLYDVLSAWLRIDPETLLGEANAAPPSPSRARRKGGAKRGSKR